MHRRGYSLIEVMTVLAVLGILLSIVTIRSGLQKQRAIRATMLADLRSLVELQEDYYSQNADYANGITGGATVNLPGNRGRISFTPSGDNTVTLHRRTAGWNATIRNPGVTLAPRRCGVFVGPPSNSPNSKVTAEGALTCW